MSRARRFLPALLLATTLATAACSTSPSGTTTNPTPSTTADAGASGVDPVTVVLIDVRTPEEFADGHLAGARNIPVESAEFTATLATLDKTASYAVYCRSGRRSQVAVEQMRDAGFTDVVDLGAFDAALGATGLEVSR